MYGQPKNTLESLGDPRSTQKRLKTNLERPGSAQDRPGAPRRTQKHLEAPVSAQSQNKNNPGAARSTQNIPKQPKTTLGPPYTPWRTQILNKMNNGFRNTKQLADTSKMFNTETKTKIKWIIDIKCKNNHRVYSKMPNIEPRNKNEISVSRN